MQTKGASKAAVERLSERRRPPIQLEHLRNLERSASVPAGSLSELAAVAEAYLAATGYDTSEPVSLSDRLATSLARSVLQMQQRCRS